MISVRIPDSVDVLLITALKEELNAVLSLGEGAISSRWVRWMVLDGALDATQLTDFLQRLIRDAQRKVFLILDNLRVHHAKVVQAWLAEHRHEIELFYLPSYSPELNPDELPQR